MKQVKTSPGMNERMNELRCEKNTGEIVKE